LSDVQAFESVSLWERVYERVRTDILSSTLPPGAELNEAALAASLGVSRGPVREAIKHLAAEGLVTMRARRGPVVSSLTHEELIDAYQVREALEALGVRLATSRLTTEQLDRLQELNESMELCVDMNAVEGFFDKNEQFHGLLVEASGNRKLIEMYEQLASQMGRYRTQSLVLRGTMKRSIAEHNAILRALRKRDPERASRLLVEHIRVPQRRAESAQEASG
jgi:DNA-binding GntR family transcriptional regulator